MKYNFRIAFIVILGCLFSAKSASALDIPLGGIGGVGDIVPGTGLVLVTSVTPGGPGALGGLQPGDFIRGANGIMFSPTSTNDNDGYVGAIQDLAMAVDRAEGSGGALSLQVIRSGVGGITLNLNLSAAGSLGPAWPVNTGKTASMFEWSCDQIHAMVQASATGDFGYNSGWFGMILLAHPDWNQTSGANPFRTSINKLRTRCESYINGRILEPAEEYYWNGSDVVANPAYVNGGLENWDICSSAMFLALYRTKTGDTTANAVVQRAAEAIAHRIQHWKQYDNPGPPHIFGGGIGRMGHGGVVGDYSHTGGIGALNIINAHALPALALLKNAGANMNTNLGLSINAFTYNPGLVQPTIEQKFRICWDFVKAATAVTGSDDGNVGYSGRQGGGDSAARTPGCFAGWKLYGMTANADDIDKNARQADYFTRFWFRQQHAHAYTVGGVVLSQLAMPFLDYRRERFFQENTRLYSALARNPDGSIAYFPGRQNNGGDGYLDYNRVALINTAMATAIRTGSLPGFPAPDSTRIHAWMRSPVNSWPSIEARRVVLTGGLSHALDLDITDANGTILAPSNYTAAWTHVSGPSTVTFGSPALADTTVTVSQAGTYRVNLQVTRGAYVLNEPYDLVVSATPPPGDLPPVVVTDPVSLTVDQGDSATFTVTAQGTAPILYQWRRNGVPFGLPSSSSSFTIGSVSAGSAGAYDCVITNIAGTVTSASAALVVNGVGTFRWGGLWRDVFIGIDGSNVSDLTSSVKYPLYPDVSGVITNAESPSNYGDDYGQRWSGWITPPQTGNYRFYIACDDKAELWISTDHRRANRVLRAKESSYRALRDWPTSTSDESVSPQLALVAGQRYYIELLHKENFGGDNAAITWDWKSTGVWANPTPGSVPFPGAILEYQEGGTLDDNIHPPANYAPVAFNQALVIYGSASTPVQLTAQDFENSALTYSVITNPTKGALSGTVPNLVYTPFPGASGIDSFTFKANDGSLVSEPATVTLSMIPESGTDLKIWNGSSSALWTTAANWNGSVVPDANDAVIFNGDSLANLATSLGANRTISRIVVSDPAGPVSIANNTLTLSGGIEMLGAYADLTISSALSISADQQWSVGSGRTLLKSGDTSGSKTLTKTGPGTLEFSGVSSMTGGIVVNDGTLKLSGGGWYTGYVGGSGTVTVNQGATAINVNSHSFGSSNNPTRDIILNGGTFLFADGTYVDDVTSTAGLIANTFGETGDLRSSSSNNSVLTVNASDQPTVVNVTFNAVGPWTINVANGAASNDLVINGLIIGTNAITKSGAGRMLVTSALSSHTGSFTVSAGEVTVTGSLTSGMSVQSAGTLSGTGTVQGTVNQSGIVSPGIDSTAVLYLGTLSQTSTATTQITLNGTSPGSEHDQVIVAGAATLGGTLQVTLQSGFTPAVGDVFDVITCASRTGTFSTISLPALPVGREWLAAYNGGPTAGLRLSVVTPASLPSVAWMEVSQSSASESGTMTVTAQLSATSAQNVTVPFTVTGSATTGTDFTITASPITIAAGATTGSATLTIISDTIGEPNETVILTMGTPTNATKGATTVHTATITDDDAPNTPPTANAGPDQSVTLSSWSPLSMSPAAWFDGSNASSITAASGAVSQWNDLSGNNNNLVQGTAVSRPKTATVTINGLNAVDFDGLDDKLAMSSNPFSPTINNALLIMVHKVKSISATGTLFSLSGTESNRWQSHAPWSDGKLYFDTGGVSEVNRVSATFGATVNEVVLSSFYGSTTNNVQQVYKNGSLLIGDATGHAVATAGNPVIGGVGSYYQSTSIAEMVMIKGTVSIASRQELEGYLAHKWGLTASLPAAHPYKSAAPTNGGFSATATLAGSASDADNNPLTTTWTVVSKPAEATVTFANASAPNTTVTFNAVGSYVLKLTASDGAATDYDEVTITVNYGTGLNAFAAWAAIGGGGITFTGDANADGLADGMGWLLGAANPTQGAHGLLPQPTAATNGDLTLSFKMLNSSKRGTAVLRLERSRDLGVTDLWASNVITIPDASATVAGVVFIITPINGTDHNQVVATIPAAAANGTGKLFARLSGLLAP